MKKAIAFLVVATMVMSVAVVGTATAAKNGQAGKSNIAHMYLYEKDPSDWSIVDGGAWGKMQYNLAGPTFDFVFNGHGLEPNTEYSLIYYGDPWPGNHPGALIASGASNEGGNIHLACSVDLGMDLPDPADANYPTGAKIWLVLSSDYGASTNAMKAWNPTEYLFDGPLITYDDTDL
ncbi:MAG: hypothetical protein PHS47_04180 [Methanocellales archaeon]|nr:hypothetical protein [Methanocellales archaeon]MDD3421477.1 hypothetical protein [Methanocellales archaeon]MDD4898916.1 hypothetical protein [Methanocellales archaeon]MDD5446633.1 hypothetical protein [Methanocellales archaeon]